MRRTALLQGTRKMRFEEAVTLFCSRPQSIAQAAGIKSGSAILCALFQASGDTNYVNEIPDHTGYAV